MLEVRGVDARYGDAQALWGVAIDVAAAETVCIIGPNGAGKTTLFRMIVAASQQAATAGDEAPDAGTLRWSGVDLERYTLSALRGARG